MKPLEGARVLDLGWVWAGPLVGSALADLGADVVKVETRTRLDPYRLRGVERAKEYGDLRHEASPSFHKLNHSKRSLSLNLQVSEARDTLLRLVSRADVLIENFRAGKLDALGFTWIELQRTNPRLVAVAMSAGGQVGRWRDLKAYALITTALAGYESLIGYPDEDPIGGATFGVADPVVSSFAVLAVAAALHRARESGIGSYIDLSGVESMIGIMGYGLLTEDGLDASSSLPLDLTTPARGEDQWVIIALSSPDEWRLLVDLSGVGRGVALDVVLNGGLEDIRQELARWSRQYDRDALALRLRDAGVPAASVLSVEERNARSPIADSLREVEHPITGRDPIHDSPWGNFADRKAAPILGADTDDVLREWLGMGDVEIAKLREVGALE